MNDSRNSSRRNARNTFKPDEERGKWCSKFDFYLTCIGHTLGVQTFCVIANIGIISGGVIQFFPLMLNIVTLAVPMYFIQSFMGQFSSSGCVSVLRIAPIFKGIGYASLILNIASVTYCSVLAAYQFLYLISSLQLDLPWASCNHPWNTPNCSEILDTSDNITFGDIQYRAGAEYFGAVTKSSLDRDSQSEFTGFSFAVFAATAIVWAITLLIVLNGVKTMGRLMRIMTIISLLLLMILTFRSFLLAGAASRFGKTLIVDMNILATPSPWIFSPMINAMVFGSGWSTVLTLSSYNDFKMNVQKYSVVIPFCVFGLLFVVSVLVASVLAFLQGIGDIDRIKFGQENLEFPFLVFTYFVTKIETPQIWASMFFLMLFLLELNSVIVQTLTVTTAFFDEFAYLRNHKRAVTFAACAFAFALSTIFAKEDGYIIFYQLVYFGLFSKLGLAFFEIIVYLFIYGRQRLVRDIRFMLGDDSFGLWKFYFLRFVTPPTLLIAAFFAIFASVIALRANFVSITLVLLMKMLPWLFIPLYAIYELYLQSGTISERISKSLQPVDWHPVVPTVREVYEEETLHLRHDEQLSASEEETEHGSQMEAQPEPQNNTLIV